MYTKKDLKGRGWTDRLIERFLGPPDHTRINGFYRSGPPVCLYDVNRVHSAESLPEFKDLQQKLAVRRQASARAVATKREKTRQLVEGIEIKIPVLDEQLLTRKAVEHYNALKGGNYVASTDSDDKFLDRIRVNYLRHELTHYETHLQETAGNVGARDAYADIKKKVLDAIADAYPELASECWRQIEQMEEYSLWT